jgi:hypothetical protein
VIARFLASVALGITLLGAARADSTTHHPKHDYPTAARADYVLGCLAANGFKRELLEKCACGIDTIADLMSYDDYEYASTVLGIQQGGLGERGAMFQNNPVVQPKVDALRRAQAEVNLRCT